MTLLETLRADRERHDYGCGRCCDDLILPKPTCPTARALDCAIAAIETGEGWLSVETEVAHKAMLAAMARAYLGESTQSLVSRLSAEGGSEMDREPTKPEPLPSDLCGRCKGLRCDHNENIEFFGHEFHAFEEPSR